MSVMTQTCTSILFLPGPEAEQVQSGVMQGGVSQAGAPEGPGGRPGEGGGGVHVSGLGCIGEKRVKWVGGGGRGTER